jgi:hypothetical protein
MSEHPLYPQIETVLSEYISQEVAESTKARLVTVILGILAGKNASPANIAKAVHSLGLSRASVESIERRVRRYENDEGVSSTLCFHPLARAYLAMGKPTHLTLILDPTTQEDRVVMLTASVYYRGRALPLAWMCWEANQPLKGDGFWTRVKQVLAEVATLIPAKVDVTWLADRAFGTPQFTDLVQHYGWHYVVRVQGQTHYQTITGQENAIRQLVHKRGTRRKLRGFAFKKLGWRCVSVVVWWGRNHPQPLCLVSDLPPDFALVKLYRRRYTIEASFRDFKTYGWNWERGQVKSLDHLHRLLIAMALAAWLTVMVGTHFAAELLAQPPSGKRFTRPFNAKFSLFALGLQLLDQWLHRVTWHSLAWSLSGWDVPNWFAQLTNYHTHAALFAPTL